jgi:hypothetical protein
MSEIRMCTDRIAPPRRRDERLALLSDAMWGSRYNLTVAFLDGEPSLQERVQRAALEWTRHAAIQFVFTTGAAADIRVSFSRRGSWASIGRQALDVYVAEPTMNFGWLTLNSSDEELTAVVLHEFGHALGCLHEHQHPAGGIPWNKPAVYDYYAGYPNYWTAEKVDQNIFSTYAADLTIHTDRPDRESVMMYPIDKRLTDGVYAVGLNARLSDGDIGFIRQAYP